jgi:hypothetical protein
MGGFQTSSFKKKALPGNEIYEPFGKGLILILGPGGGGRWVGKLHPPPGGPACHLPPPPGPKIKMSPSHLPFKEMAQKKKPWRGPKTSRWAAS